MDVVSVGDLIMVLTWLESVPVASTVMGLWTPVAAPFDGALRVLSRSHQLCRCFLQAHRD